MINYNIENNLIYIEASGKVTYGDLKEILPVVDEVIEKNGKPKFFIKLKDFHG